MGRCPEFRRCAVRCLTLLTLLMQFNRAIGQQPSGIQVVDRATGRGIPLVELTTVDGVVYLTDSGGRVALNEPELHGQTVFFTVRSPGYAVDRDGFGMEGVRLQLQAGSRHRVELQRSQLAQRLYRVTGRDIWLDTVRLGETPGISAPLVNAGVVGQDSVQTAVYQGRMFWFWGDTSRLSYPLGLFRTAGAVSGLPGQSGLQPSVGVNLAYYVGADGFARAMAEVSDPTGVVWIQGVSVVRDEAGRERMVCSFSRRRGLEEPLQQGHLLWNDQREVFELLDEVGLSERWRLLREHPVKQTMEGVEYLCFGAPFPVTRVPARLESLSDPRAWESWTCAADELDAGGQSQPQRAADGRLCWGWKRAAPTTQQDEQRWLRAGLVQPEEICFLPVDAEQPKRRVLLHGGSVHYNQYRRRWVLIANEQAWEAESPSFLGEVYYSESETAQGPFRQALKVATHPGQSFYNPCQHPEFDEAGGQRIFFEGTYTNTFTKSVATPRYNYNQLMYMLDLRDDRVVRAFGEPGGG
ncbi:MAG: hypothetical protein RIT02_3011 [Planctomycetota bacterium]